MEHKLLWVWISIKPGMNAAKITNLWDSFNTIEDIYEAEHYDNIEGIGESDKRELSDKSLDEAKRVCEKVARLNGKILVFDDKYYPDALRNIIDPPYVLYTRGELPQWERRLLIGVVGTRKNTAYGLNAVNKIVPELASRGVVIVSGMAQGIDAAASRAAIASGGKTIAVLGSGLDVIYPKMNEDLYYNILASHGLIVTEYPPGSGALPHHFPARNRIIAGLSRGVLVAEAPQRSGSLITANIALENGRDVFAVPGDISQNAYTGTNRLINKGAKLTMCAEDIISEYPYEARFLKNADIDISAVFEPVVQEFPQAAKQKASPKIKKQEVKSKEKPISIEDKKYSLLGEKEKSIISLLIEENMHIDEIARKTQMPVNEINTMMVMLEMNGYIKKMPGNNFRLKI